MFFIFNIYINILIFLGLFTLWRGCTPTVVRAMSINFGMLASYDEIKERAA